jgi:dihydrofolate reductase
LRSDIKFTIVVAMAMNRAIGMRGEMPWHLPDELKHFKKITLGKPVIMGRKTRESIGMALPGRQNIVISRNTAFTAPGCQVAASLEQAADLANGPELMVIGGGELYRQTLPLAVHMYLTIVDCSPEADTWFPEWDSNGWERIGTVRHASDQRHQFSFEMQEWIRPGDASRLPG